MTLEIDVSDSTETLYDLIVAEDDIDAEVIDQAISQTVATQVEELYNNREEIAEQLAAQDAESKPAE